jgi:hypothetical protein
MLLHVTRKLEAPDSMPEVLEQMGIEVRTPDMR